LARFLSHPLEAPRRTGARPASDPTRHGADRRLEARRRRSALRFAATAALRAGGRTPDGTRAPVDRSGVRARGDRRCAAPRHGVGGRTGSRGMVARRCPRAAVRDPAARTLRRTLRRPALRAPARRHPPRHQAVERARRRRRAPATPRLRSCAAVFDGLRRHADDRVRRHARVQPTGGVRRHGDRARRARRRLVPRRGVVRTADGSTSVRR
jgi:hypothetical protein